MNLNEMTETDQKVYMINCLAAIKDAINAEGGNITDSTPYDQYASKISGATVIEAKEITPTTSEQTITASGSVDGFSPITVKPVTASIDANIIAGNIKSGVTILGVEGTYTGEKGSFDGATQTLTFNNAYIVGLINELSGESAALKETLLGYIGDNDLTFDLSNATESDEIITCDSENTVTPEGEDTPLSLAVLSWKAVDGVASIVIADAISIADATVFAIEGIENLDDLIPFGVAMDKNIITITGTQGAYNIVFN